MTKHRKTIGAVLAICILSGTAGVVAAYEPHCSGEFTCRLATPAEILQHKKLFFCTKMYCE